MKVKNHIAVFLVTIFLVKFAAIDANGLNVLFSGSDIAFVNSHCKKKNSPKQKQKTADYSQADLSAAQVITLNGFCNSQFQFEPFSWETDLSETMAVSSEHFPSRFSYLYPDNPSPPPRLA